MARQPAYLTGQQRTLGRYLAALRQAAKGCPFASRATPVDLDIDPIEHLQHMMKVLMDNDNIFGANSVILSAREQIGNLQQLRQHYQGESRKKLLRLQPSSVTCADGSTKTLVPIVRLIGLVARLNGRTCATSRKLSLLFWLGGASWLETWKMEQKHSMQPSALAA